MRSHAQVPSSVAVARMRRHFSHSRDLAAAGGSFAGARGNVAASPGLASAAAPAAWAGACAAESGAAGVVVRAEGLSTSSSSRHRRKQKAAIM